MRFSAYCDDDVAEQKTKESEKAKLADDLLCALRQARGEDRPKRVYVDSALLFASRVVTTVLDAIDRSLVSMVSFWRKHYPLQEDAAKIASLEQSIRVLEALNSHLLQAATHGVPSPVVPSLFVPDVHADRGTAGSTGAGNEHILYPELE